MKTFRVWFSDGTATLVNARNTDEARREALVIAKKNGYDLKIKIRKVEEL